MITDMFFTRTYSVLERSLDLRGARHEIISSNIANMDTPGYKAFDIMVEEEMQKEESAFPATRLKRTHQGHMSGNPQLGQGVMPKMIPADPLSMRHDGNTVDLDKSMADLSENNLLYHISAQLISRKFQGLLSVIKEGK